MGIGIINKFRQQWPEKTRSPILTPIPCELHIIMHCLGTGLKTVFLSLTLLFMCRSRPCTGLSKSAPDDLQGVSTALEEEDEYSSSEESEGLTETQSSLSKLSSARGFSPQPDHNSD